MDLEDLLKSLKSSLPEGILEAAKETAKKMKGITLPDLDLDASPETKEKNIMILKEVARALTEQAKYYEASSVLEMVENHEEETDLSTKLVMGECYLSLGREAKAMRCINSVQKFLLKSPAPPASEAFEMVESMVDANAYLRALILVPVAASLYEHCAAPEDAVEGMFRCIKKANDCARPMIKEGGRSRVLAVDFGLDFMEDCLERMLKIKNVDPQKLAFKHCHISSWTGYIYWSLHDNAKGLKVRQKGIDDMDRAFGAAANQRRIYSNTCYNMGVGYAILNKNEQAKDAYEKAINAAEHATDFDSETDRQKELQMYRQKLKELRYISQ